MFALMSNQMQLNREKACLAVAGEYGPEGTVSQERPPARAGRRRSPAERDKPAQIGETPARSPE